MASHHSSSPSPWVPPYTKPSRPADAPTSHPRSRPRIGALPTSRAAGLFINHRLVPPLCSRSSTKHSPLPPPRAGDPACPPDPSAAGYGSYVVRLSPAINVSALAWSERPVRSPLPPSATVRYHWAAGAPSCQRCRLKLKNTASIRLVRCPRPLATF